METRRKVCSRLTNLAALFAVACGGTIANPAGFGADAATPLNGGELEAGADRPDAADHSDSDPDAVSPRIHDAAGDAASSPASSTVDGGVPTVGTAVGPEVLPSSYVQSARANCDLPHGPAESPQTVGAKRALLVGSWLLCSVQGSSQYGVVASSMAFTADGRWYNLLLDSNGGLVHGYGVNNQGTYSIGFGLDGGDSQPLNGEYNVYISFASGGSDGDPVSFESAPRRMQILIGSTNVFEWYVPLL